jgi:hypothetical protein
MAPVAMMSFETQATRHIIPAKRSKVRFDMNKRWRLIVAK